MKKSFFPLRIAFVLIWSIFTFLNFILWMDLDFDPFGFVLGFHFPLDSFVYFLGNVFGSSDVQVLLTCVSVVASVVFFVLCVISLLRLTKGYMFEWLVVADTAFSILLWGAHCVLTSDYSVAYLLVIRGVKLAVILGMLFSFKFILKCFKKETTV